MTFIKSWALSLCACAIVGTVFSMLAPRGSMDKILKLMISVFIMSSMLMPFLSHDNVKLDFDDFFPSSVSEEELQKNTNEMTLKSAQMSIENTIKSTLKSLNLADFTVAVKMGVDESNNVFAEKTTVFVNEDDATKAERIKGEIKTLLGLDAEVVKKEGNAIG